jgi:hypothetical protein
MNTNESPIEKLMQSLMPNADDEERGRWQEKTFNIYLSMPKNSQKVYFNRRN